MHLSIIFLHWLTFRDQKLPGWPKLPLNQSEGELLLNQPCSRFGHCISFFLTCNYKFAIEPSFVLNRVRIVKNYLSSSALDLSQDDILTLNEYNSFGRDSSKSMHEAPNSR